MKEQKWIPVTERLPELKRAPISIREYYCVSDPVLAYGKSKNYIEGDPMIYIACYEDDREGCDFGFVGWQEAHDLAELEVIAWMPLPEPYKEDLK